LKAVLLFENLHSHKVEIAGISPTNEKRSKMGRFRGAHFGAV
jgi:hypothetical protein